MQGRWDAFLREMFDPAPLGYRRRKKGRRAKSGQWWRRIPPIEVVEPWPPTAGVRL